MPRSGSTCESTSLIGALFRSADGLNSRSLGKTPCSSLRTRGLTKRTQSQIKVVTDCTSHAKTPPPERRLRQCPPRQRRPYPAPHPRFLSLAAFERRPTCIGACGRLTKRAGIRYRHRSSHHQETTSYCKRHLSASAHLSRMLAFTRSLVSSGR